MTVGSYEVMRMGSNQVGTVSVIEIVGVYNADGGPIGEAKYIFGKFLGTAHCALCDITHSAIRRKRDWDRLVAALDIPITLLHLNELPADVSAALETAGPPVVLARLDDGNLVTLLDDAALESAEGSVSVFERALKRALTLLHRTPG